MSCIDQCFETFADDVQAAGLTLKATLDACSTTACIIAAVDAYKATISDKAEAFATCAANCHSITPPTFES